MKRQTAPQEKPSRKEARKRKSDSENDAKLESKKRAAIEKTAKALLAAISDAVDANIAPSDHLAGILGKLIDATGKYAVLPPAPPFTPLPLQQMPSTWQIAQLAVQIGQCEAKKLPSLVHALPEDLTQPLSASQDDYETANELTYAALTILRSAHDMRQVWHLRPQLQKNYQAGRLYVSTPSGDKHKQRESRVRYILASRLAPKPSDQSRFDPQLEHSWTIINKENQHVADKDRFAEYWTDVAFVSWDHAAILFFRNEGCTPQQKNPGKASKMQNELLETFVTDYLESCTALPSGENVDSKFFIEEWKRVTPKTHACKAKDAHRPSFLEAYSFTDWWHGLIEFFEVCALKQVSTKMKQVRAAGQKQNAASS